MGISDGQVWSPRGQACAHLAGTDLAALLGRVAGTVNTRMRDGLIRLRDCLGVQ